MASYNYERLSAQDNTFLFFETPRTHMHVSSTLIFESGPLKTETGGVDFDRIQRATASYLHRIPRYRQKLHFVPIEGGAVWVDDKNFSLDYHVRHTSLPKPGNDEQLKALSSRIMAQPLDRNRPLWETWVVEGLENDRFALITKIHHCMIDGSSGVDLAQIMMSTTPDREIAPAPPFVPRPAPTRRELVVEELKRRVSMPLEVVRDFRQFARETEDLVSEMRKRASILAEMFGEGFSAGDSPLNGPLGPHRSFDWMQLSLADLKAVRRGLDCSVNDVVLTVVTGAVREFLLMRGVDPRKVEFKISAPVSVRSEAEKGQLGNRVSSWIIELPIEEADPSAQLKRIHEITQDLKDSNQALGVEMMMRVAEYTPSSLLSLGSQSASGAVNSIVTNVPGPQFPLYMQGAKLESMFPQVPLLENMGLGIALVSYNGKIGWGFNANPDVLPDLDNFVDLVRESFERVAATAGVTPGDRPLQAVSATSKATSKARKTTRTGDAQSQPKRDSGADTPPASDQSAQKADDGENKEAGTTARV